MQRKIKGEVTLIVVKTANALLEPLQPYPYKMGWIIDGDDRSPPIFNKHIRTHNS